MSPRRLLGKLPYEVSCRCERVPLQSRSVQRPARGKVCTGKLYFIMSTDRRQESDRAFGELVKKARIELQLTQEELAIRARLSRGTARNVESGKHHASLQTRRALQQVLGPLIPLRADFGTETESLRRSVTTDHCSRLQDRLRAACTRDGGVVPYGFLPSSERLTIAHLGQFASYEYQAYLDQHRAALEKIINQLGKSADSSAINIISLTCGHGWLELWLAQLLSDRLGNRVQVYLVAPSPWLLQRGREAADVIFAGRSDIGLKELPAEYEQIDRLLEQIPPVNRRVFCAFGMNSNIDDPSGFFRRTVGLMRAKDLFILDAAFPVDKPCSESDIRRKDPRLSGNLSLAWQVGPSQTLQAAVSELEPGMKFVSFEEKLVIPEGEKFTCYQIDIVNTFINRRGDQVQVSGVRINRYFSQSIIKLFSKLNCNLIIEDLSASGSYPVKLYLFQRN